MAYQRIPAGKDEDGDRDRSYEGRKNDQCHRGRNSFDAEKHLTGPRVPGTNATSVRVSVLLKSRGHGN